MTKLLALLLCLVPLIAWGSTYTNCANDGSAADCTSICAYDGNSNKTCWTPGDSSADLTWTFPTAYPSADSVLTSTSGGVISASTGPTLSQVILSGTTAGTLTTKSYEGVSAAMSGASVTITMSIPATAQILATTCRVETLIESAAATSFTAQFSGGSSSYIGTGVAFAKDTKILSYTTDVTSAVTNLILVPNTGTFTAGVCRCIVWTREIAIANTP